MKAPVASGFREIEHTADWELEVWAPDLRLLLEQAARGMAALAGVRLAEEPVQTRRIELEAADAESLLVGFLSELLYLSESENLGFDRFEIELQGLRLHARLQGAPIVRLDKEIKAVTYHRLQIQTTPQGLRVRIVFDV